MTLNDAHDASPKGGNTEPIPGKTDVYKADNTSGRMPTTIGETWSAKELTQMNIRNVNKVASLANGVNSRDGETPNIKAAGASGTAYYIDGVRVYNTTLQLR